MKKEFVTERRYNKIKSALAARQPTLQVALENIHDPHNVSAILRTCDAVGVQKISLIYTIEKFPRISRISSASANKWIEKDKYTSIIDFCVSAKKEKYKIYSSAINEKAVSLYELDLTQKTILVFGNEHRGITEELQNNSDLIFYIPMKGMVQSLNVSVAAAVSLYEGFRQREKKKMYSEPQLDDNNFELLINQWLKK